jgi:hypothetical protein
MSISIYSVHYNNMNFLLLQHENLFKHCKDDFEFTVINNGANSEVVNQIHNFCIEKNIREIKSSLLDNNRALGSSTDHIRALRDVYLQHVSEDTSTIRVVIDSDLIPFKDFSFHDLLEDYELAGVDLGNYLSSFIVIYTQKVDLRGFDITTIFDGGDSGVWTRELFKKYRTKRLLHTCPMKEREIAYVFKNTPSNIIPCKPTYGIQIIGECLLHYYRGTGWDNGNIEFHKEKLNFFKSFLEDYLSYCITIDKNVHYESAHIDEWLHKDIYPLYKL